jgi:hypothetical protein
MIREKQQLLGYEKKYFMSKYQMIREKQQQNTKHQRPDKEKEIDDFSFICHVNLKTVLK